MKRNLIYSVFAVLLLASCSKEEIPVPAPAPETLDAYISLGISNGMVNTKSATRAAEQETGTSDPSYGEGDDNVPDPDGTTAINTFTVAVFRGAPTGGVAAADGITTPVVEPEGTMIYLNTFDATTPLTSEDAQKLCNSGIVKKAGSDKEYQINGIKVKAGNLYIMIMANMPKGFLTKSVTMAQLQDLVYGDLEHEGYNNEGSSFPCSMSSKLLKVKIDPNMNSATTDAEKLNNKVYYVLADGETAEAAEKNTGATTDSNRQFEDYTGEDSSIPLYRNVSAVAFKTITLAPGEGWGKKNGATLTLKSIFVTNAISSTSMTTGVTPSKKEFFCGHKDYKGKGQNAVLATTGNKQQDYLIKEWKSDQPEISVSGTSSDFLPTDPDKCVGKYFMVYENSKKMGLGDGEHTLLTLCADYTYTDDQGEEHTSKDRFYTVIVNDESNIGAAGSTGYGTYVNRNYIYNIKLTVVGPGSEKPFTPLYTANATAFVEAADWTGAVNIDQDAE